MSPHIRLTATEREKLGALVNNISVYAAQIIASTPAGLVTTALDNLTKLKREQEELIKRVDELAREHGEESPLRLLEDVHRVPADVAQLLTLVRRCLAASAFLGHLLAQPNDPQLAVDPVKRETLLH